MKWVSVKHRLPPINKTVLVCYPSGFNGVPIYAWGARVADCDGWMWATKNSYGSDIRPDRDANHNDIEPDDDYKVTHWATLIRPPFKKPIKPPLSPL